jgi:hypothetical protein
MNARVQVIKWQFIIRVNSTIYIRIALALRISSPQLVEEACREADRMRQYRSWMTERWDIQVIPLHVMRSDASPTRRPTFTDRLFSRCRTEIVGSDAKREVSGNDAKESSE